MIKMVMICRALFLFIKAHSMMLVFLVVEILYVLRPLLVLTRSKGNHDRTALLNIVYSGHAVFTLIIYHFQIFLEISSDL
jgi:hypothetical protein